MRLFVFFSQIVLISALLLWPINLLVTNGFGFLPVAIPTTIFNPDYQAKQLILRNTYLYPNVFLARVFQNKLNIPVSKFENNLFSLLDPNYYFFSSHPREMYHNQNLVKFPFVLLIFLLYGLVSIAKLKNYPWLIGSFLIIVFILSLLFSFDKYDLILWPIFCLIIFHGYQELSRRSLLMVNVTVLLLFIVTFIEYLRLFIKA